ncbi:MAG: EF-Tu/IF-2/RF-3 family GTPase [Candidatus Thermoplasmatota archaeon]|uniref:EF-Tu/IF-2/RF-3 family GTPase n=1 Tax=Ferroplasma sp. TaxID=2591003 RepID=UPI002621ADD8|nr:EF-Tu/IF-2/RF-3 family GTPase [Ferroplasma sp.]MCL4312482.1 EF-Tu/IF-2/RF-3 family GTPase [Candidatus Thermoplasmatota archaeon]
MESYSIFCYNASDYVKEIAKVGTNSDILLYHRKDEDIIMTFIEPVKYPEKVSSLTDSIYPSDIAIVKVSTINKDLGEVIVALDLMGKTRGFIITGDEQKPVIKKIIENTSLKDYKFFDGKPMELIDEIKAMKIKRDENNSMTVIDHFFKVKGVGTVALGFVLSGTISKHQKLILSDLDREVEVRSIQMNDEDVDTAAAGSRVGLALKNIEPSDMERGMFLSDKPFEYAETINGKVIPQKSLKLDLGDDFEVFVSDIMRFQRGKFENDHILLDRKIPIIKKTVVLANNNIVPRVFGTINL